MVTLQLIGALLLAGSYPGVQRSCYRYVHDSVELRGRVVRRVYPGRPNYESVKGGDAPDTVYVLRLVMPLCTSESTEGTARANIAEVQLSCPVADSRSVKAMKGKTFTMRGTLEEWSFGWHHLPVLFHIGFPSAAQQSALVDVFGDAQVNDDNFELHSPRGTPLEQRALLSANLSGKGFEARSRVIDLGVQRFVLVRGWTGEGTGLQQVSYLVFVPFADSLRLIWSAVAEEISTPPRAFQSPEDKPYDYRGCLFVSGDTLLAYVGFGAPNGKRALDEPPARRSGLYAWSRSTSDFRRVAAAPESAVRTCQGAPGAANR